MYDGGAALAELDVRGEDVAERRVLVAGDDDGQVGLRSREEPAFVGRSLVQIGADRLDELVEVLVPETAVAPLGGALPHGNDVLFDGAEGLVLGDARVGDPPHAVVEDLRVVALVEVTVVGEVAVVVVRDEAEERLLEVGARHGQAVDEARADGWGDRDAELSRGHRARDRPEHAAAALDVAPIGDRRLPRRARVEVPVVADQELQDR
jgi:hypothetical protein